jgi:type VII secretion effector (TIGR04197 family)
MTVTSNIIVVKSLETKMKSSIQLLDKNFNINTATNTSIAGNLKAHDVANSLQSILQIFKSCFENDINNVVSIATAIEDFDTNYRNMFELER